MKKTLLILSLLTLTVITSNAQYSNKTRVMVVGEGGINLSTFYQAASTERTLSLGNVTRPTIGLYVKTKYPTLIGFDAGVSLSQQGTNTKDSLSAYGVFGDSAISKAILNYAYVYGDALYYFELQGDNSVHAGAGLYAGYAMNGDRVFGSDKEKLQIDNFKRVDFGFQLKIAFNIKEFISLGAQYRIAFLPILTSFDRSGNTNNLRNSVLALTAGIRLFELKK
ncbi:outer membrane beta-barrel protein [Panacibacter sp. DH6]|uniref:Outer membrane beta-barrel protein n=1 Tax=Panacibacter microcysteis TaxID=2793269 RepID=A0A931GYT9_9BACT|nr:outer membrane beta-barrel protein [Panacibacter microcysteis]MBG9377742.1 outer membrane beta-barrel protein [Panacibacter microcysteis]